MSEKKIWFRKKRYGWGWTPNTWQGWLTVVLYIVILNLYPFLSNRDGSFSFPVFFSLVAVLTLLLFIVCYLKGEKPAWSWGDDEK